MSKEHKAALAEGRRQARAIKEYLSAMGSRRPGRPVTRETLEARLERISNQLNETTDPLAAVELTQMKLDVENQLSRFEDAEDLSALEDQFVQFAKAYSDRKGITYTAWRQVGVPAATLRKAGIKETRRR